MSESVCALKWKQLAGGGMNGWMDGWKEVAQKLVMQPCKEEEERSVLK